MPLKINQSIESKEELTYNNDLKTYSGFYFDTLTSRTATDMPWSSIATNDNNGHMLGVSANGSTNTGTNVLVFSNNGGETWTNITITAGLSNWKSVCFGAQKYVAVSSSGTSLAMRVMYSSGNNSFSPTSTNDFSFVTTGIENNNWESIAYGNSYFVAVASSGTNRVMVSKDGINWSSVVSSIFSGVSWDFISYSQELRRFVIVSNDGSGKIAYSNSNPSFSTSWNLSITIINSVVFNSVTWSSKLKKFIAVGNSGNIYNSSDGITWEKVFFLGSNNLRSVIWSQELELIVIITDSNITFTGYTLPTSSLTSNSWTSRIISNSSPTCLVWNRKYGSFTVLSNSGTSRVLVSKISGLNHFLDKKYYYDLLDNSNLVTFNYYNSFIRVSVGNRISIYPELNELRGFIFSAETSLPNGLTLDIGTGEISGIPTTPQNNKIYKILATFEKQIIYSYINIYISNTSESPISFTYPNNIINDLISDNYIYPEITYGTDYYFSYQLLGITNGNSFPTGIIFNPLNGLIKGISKITQQSIPYRITATNTNTSISTSKDINLEIRVINTVIESDNLRGNISTIGEWQGYVSYFYSVPDIIGGKIEKNYFYDQNATSMVFNNILTVATRRISFIKNDTLTYKKELVFTIIGNYNINNLNILTLNSYSFNFANAIKNFNNINKFTEFVWTVDDNINYFPMKDNIFYITNKNSLIETIPSNLIYSSSGVTSNVNSNINFTPTLSTGYSNDFSITPQLPINYLSFNSTNGNISGITPPISSDITHIITAKNSSGSTSTSFRIRNIYSNTNMTTGYNNSNSVNKNGFFETFGSIISSSFGLLKIESIFYQWINQGPTFIFSISGNYYFPETNLKSIRLGGQNDSTKLIVKFSNYNSITDRGYEYLKDSYSNYVINNKLYSQWKWVFPGSLQTQNDAILDYGWILNSSSQNISIFIE